VYFSGPFYPEQLISPQTVFGQYQPAKQWFGLYEDAGATWRFAGWIWTDYGTVQFLAMHLVQCQMALRLPELRYLITDARGDGVVPEMR